MALEKEDVIVTGKYDSIQINEYEGRYTLIAVSNGQNDCFYQKWARYQEKQNTFKEKAWPVKVFIGESAEEAIENLNEIIRRIGGSQEEELTVPEEDIPF